MYEVLTGKQRSLVFPIMCNAFVKLDYSDNIPDTNSNSDTSDDVAYGFWGHEGSFSFEAIITPYEINGNSTHQTHVDHAATALGVGQTRNDSKKIMAGLLQETYDLADSAANDETEMQNEKYLTIANRITHEMMIFNNDNFKVSLVNSTSHTQNNPARYKIKIQLTIGSTTQTVISDEVILPSESHSFKYNTTNGSDLLAGFDDRGRVVYAKVAEVHSGGAEDNIDLPLAGNTSICVGQELFTRSGFTFTSLGTVLNISGTDLEMSTATPVLSGGTDLFVATYRHASYIDQMFHIACLFNNRTKKISIHLNGVSVAEGTHTETGDFSFARTDTYLGSNGLNDRSVSGIDDKSDGGTASGQDAATTCKQFMGEFHELAISGKIKEIAEIDNLMPNFNDTLLYLRFEEVDL